MPDRRCRASILLPILLVLTPPSSAQTMRSTPVTSAAAEPADADGWLRQANDLWHIQKDYNAALKAFNHAVDAAPESTLVRNARAMYFDTLSGIVVPEDRKKFADHARADWSWVAEREPDSILGGVARDGLSQLDGNLLLPPKSVSCSAEAGSAHDRAEALYGAGRFDDAITEYRKATDGCPDASIFWVNFADTYYGLEQYAKAKELFERALVADPWQRAGHRFLADTEAKLGHADAALRHAALAVVSDPTYEAAWASLRLLAEGTGREWNRVYAAKAAVTGKGDGSGGTDITLDPTKGMGWTAYALGKASLLTGKKKMSALETERFAVDMALSTMGGKDSSTTPFWSMMARARDRGYLDEAIFLHLLDAPLAAEYPAFRDKNSARLTEYLETVIVPKK